MRSRATPSSLNQDSYMFAVAFYKGTRPGIQGWYNRLVRCWTRSPYSHCEMIFSDGISSSSSFLDGGVRFKEIEYKPENWDIVELPIEFEKLARLWFIQHEGDSYDVIGNIGFVIGSVDDSKKSGSVQKSSWRLLVLKNLENSPLRLHCL